MKVFLRIALCCCLAAGAGMAQRRGGGGGTGGGYRGGGGTGGGFRGGGGTGGGYRGNNGGGYRGGAIGNRGFVGGGFRGGFDGRYYGYRGFRGNYYRPYFYSSFGLGYWPGFYDYDYYSYPYYSYPAYSYPAYSYPAYSHPAYSYGPASNVTEVYPQTAQAAPTNIYIDRASPTMREYDEYGQEIRRPGAVNAPPVYLIAFKDHSIRAASAYWADNGTLHYVTLQHEQKQAALDTVDRDFSAQLNRERRVQFSLPSAQ